MSEIDTFNKFLVGMQGDRFLILNLHPMSRLTASEALNLAAWLVSLADPGGEKFLEVLAAVQAA